MNLQTQQGQGPKYKQIAAFLQEQVCTGVLPPGGKLKSETDYAAMFCVSAITIKKALAELVQGKYIQRIKGRGTFVCSSHETPPQGGSKRIALIFSSDDHGDSSHMNILKGAQRVVSAQNYSLILEWGNEERSKERAVIQKMRKQHVDGFLIYPFSPPESAANFALIDAAGIPYVLIDRYDPDRPTNHVASDHYTGAVLATNHLLSLGHKKLRFLASHLFLSSEQERYNGFCNTLQRAGIPVSANQLMETFDLAQLVQDIQDKQVTALFCCNDRLATTLLKRLDESGVRVPQDVSVMGFDDWQSPEVPKVALSTVRQNFEEIGEQSAKMLLDILSGQGNNGYTRLQTNVSLILRESTAPPA